MSAKLLRTARAFAPITLEDERPALALADAALLCRLGVWCGGCAVALRGHGGLGSTNIPPLPEGVVWVRERHGAWRLDVLIRLPEAAPLVGQVLATIAGRLDGTELEMVVGTDGEPDDEGFDDAGWHRYRGSVHGGVWQLTATYPPIDAVTLDEMLALARAGDATTFRKRFADVWPMAGVDAEEDDEERLDD
jgi:hypothetical protein